VRGRRGFSSVRTALFRLEAEGLVSREGRGWIVPPIDPEEIRQLFIYREVLETSAIELMDTGASTSILRELEALKSSSKIERNAEEMDQSGHSLHILVASLSGNRFIVKAVADTMMRLRRARWLENNPSSQGWSEHQSIVDALASGDKEAAIQLMRDYTRDTSRRLLEGLEGSRRTLRARGVNSQPRDKLNSSAMVTRAFEFLGIVACG